MYMYFILGQLDYGKIIIKFDIPSGNYARLCVYICTINLVNEKKNHEMQQCASYNYVIKCTEITRDFLT